MITKTQVTINNLTIDLTIHTEDTEVTEVYAYYRGQEIELGYSVDEVIESLNNNPMLRL